MPHTHLSHSKSRRDLAASQRRSRTHKHARLRHRLLQAERLEDRRLLAGDFELSSLLPVNGGNGSSGFVIDGITDRANLGMPMGYNRDGSQPMGDVNQDGIDDFYVSAVGPSGTATPPHAYLVFGRPNGEFPAELDLQTLNGTNGYVIDFMVPGDYSGQYGGGAGDINGDDIPDIFVSQSRPTASGGNRTYMLFGGSENLVELDMADGDPADGHIELPTFDTAPDVTRGFVINCGMYAQAVGDVNGDHVDDLITSRSLDGGTVAWIIYGRDSTQGEFFPAVYEVSLLPAGDGSEGFAIPWTASPFRQMNSAGDLNNDGIGDIVLADAYARTEAGQAWVIFGQANFPATFDLASLNGSNGFTVYGKTGSFLGGLTGGSGNAGDVNGDNVDDLLLSADRLGGPAGSQVGGAYVVFGKNTATAGPFSAVLDVSALNGSNGFVMYGVSAGDQVGKASKGGDVNGDGYDDIITMTKFADPNGITDAGQYYVVYGRPTFGASFELASLLAANGGDGSAGYALNGFASSAGSSTSIAGTGDVNDDGFADMRIGNPKFDSNGLTDNGQVYVVYGKPSTPVTTKFYVVDDATQNLTYEYNVSGVSVESYSLNTGNTAPRGAASTIAGDKTWVVDANRNVYVYNNSGGLLGSWTAGSLNTKAVVEGIATNGTDIWIVDANSDKVYKYTGAATRLSGSQNAASSFSLNSANTSPKDIVAGGTSLWVVNDSTTDKVFKYTTAGALVNSWTISTPGATSPTGITVDPASVSNIWIVDSGSDRVYQYNAAATFANNSSHTADISFALAVGNTNPQGIADPPAPSSLLVAETTVPSAEAALLGNDAALASMYDVPLKKIRIDTARSSESRAVESHIRDLNYTVGASANRVTHDNVANDKHRTEVDYLFAQWDSDPLELVSLPDLGM